MTCAEFLELADACAISALEPDEQKAAEAHLAQAGHQGCPEALARARRGWDALATSLEPVPPHARVWAGIEARIGGRPAVAPRSRSIVPWGVAIAAAVLLAVLVTRNAGEQ